VIPLEEDRLTITREAVTDLIDENTICVGVILGTTFTGEIDPIEEINDLLVEVKNTRGWDIPIHVDAAIGGFILPFTQPELRWDFRLSQVKSINVSAHKYGLVYPGLGWLIFRDTTDLPEDLVFYVNYLGDEMPSYTLNFSRGSGMLLAQYYNLLRLGWEGYAMAAKAVLEHAQYLTKRLLDTGYFDILNGAEILPVVTFQLKEPVDFSVYDLSAKLRERGWIVPAYTLPPNADAIPIMRVVVRQNFSRDMADLFVDDIKKAYAALLAPKTKTIVKQRSPREAHSVS
jgi:glutamate decarboxylase